MAAFENIGKSATEELKEFLGVFQPLSAKGAEGTKMRKAVRLAVVVVCHFHATREPFAASTHYLS